MTRPFADDEIAWHLDVAESARTGRSVCEIQAARRAKGVNPMKLGDGSEEAARYPIVSHTTGLPVNNTAQ